MSTKVFLAVSFSLGLLLFGGLIWFVDGQTINPFLVWFSYVVGVQYNTLPINCTAVTIANGFNTCPCPVGFSLYDCRRNIIYFSDDSTYSNFTVTTPTYHLSTYTTGNSTCEEVLTGTGDGDITGTCEVLEEAFITEAIELTATSCSSTYEETSELQVPSVTSTSIGSRQTVWNYVCQMEALCLVNPQLVASFHLDMEDAISSLKARRYPNPKISHFP